MEQAKAKQKRALGTTLGIWTCYSGYILYIPNKNIEQARTDVQLREVNLK
jgi:ABC-type transporter lipoprotein component MlaA